MDQKDQTRREQELSRSSQVKQLLENKLLQESLDTLKKIYSEALLEKTGAKESDTREKLWIAYNVVGKVEQHLKSILESSSKEEDEEEYMSESDLEKKFTDIGSSITALETKLNTTMDLTRDDVTKTLKEFELIFKSSQERGNLGEYRIEQLLSDLGLIEGTHWKAKQKHKDHGTIPDYTFYFPNGVFVNLDSTDKRIL